MNNINRTPFNLITKCFSIFKSEKKEQDKTSTLQPQKIVTPQQIQNHPIIKAQKVKPQAQKKVLRESFNEFGTASAHRINTIQENRNIQQRKLDYYESVLLKKLPAKYRHLIPKYHKSPTSLVQLLEALPLTKNERKELMPIAENIVYAHKMIQALEGHRKNNVSWLPSTFVRDCVKQNKTSTIPSSPVNLRVQKFSSTKAKIPPFTFARLGVIYDPRDPGNTVKELEDFIKKGPKSKALEAEIKKRELQITKLSKNKKNARKIKAIEISLIPLRMIQAGNLEEARGIVNEKKRFTDDQMLQLITTQLNSRAGLLPKVRQNASFFLTHLSLLNETKAIVHGSGLIMDEGRFIIEMAETFRRFEGKKIIFDGKGPLIDENGNVHSDKILHLGKNQPKELVIKPLFANLTVQRNTTNGPLQREHNNKSIKSLKNEIQNLRREKLSKLEAIRALNSNQNTTVLEQEIANLDALLAKLNSIQAKLAKNQSNYNLACDYFPALIEFSRLRQGNDAICTPSLCCFSGKDRTHIVAAVTTHRAGVKPAVQALENDPKKQKKILSGFAKRILYDPNSLGAQILYENTGAKTFKVSSLFIPEVAENVGQLARRVLEFPKTIMLER